MPTNIKAAAIINADATPNTLNPSHLTGGFMRQAVATAEVPISDASAVVRLARVRSSDRISSIGLANDALTAGVGTIGLYRTAREGGAAVSTALFATGLSLASASVAFGNVAFNNVNIDKAEKRVWELLALTTDPGLEYDLALTMTTATTAGGTVSAHVTMITGN